MQRSEGKSALVVAAHGVAVLLFMVSVMASRLPAQATSPAQAGKQVVPANLLNSAAPTQPIPYSHKVHLSLPGMQCQTCHTNPAPGELMGFPATSMCMQCHATAAVDRPTVQKLAQYAKSKDPVPWVRVYTIRPSHAGEVHEAYERSSGVAWSHGKHLAAGLTCEACHGPVAEMDAMAEVTSAASKGGCLTCHSPRAAAATKAKSTACATCHGFFQNALETDWRALSQPR